MSIGKIINWPFSRLLLLFYNMTGNYGIALILFAAVIRLVMMPFQMKGKRSTMRTTRLAPKLKELEKKHAGNKQKYQEAVSQLYKEEKINPMSGCIWILIPLPIVMLLFSIIREPLTTQMLLSPEQITTITDYFVSMGMYVAEQAGTYKEIILTNLIHENFPAISAIVPEVLDINLSFLGMNLGASPDWMFFARVNWGSLASWLPQLGLFILPVVSGVFAYLQALIAQKTTPQTPESASSAKMMLYMSPIMSMMFGFQLPAALSLYWAAGSLLSVFQDLWLNKRYTQIMDEEDAQRIEEARIRAAELAEKRKETEQLRREGVTQESRNTSKRKRQVKEKVKEEERQTLKKDKASSGDNSQSQVGMRRYARGRAYSADRFESTEFEVPDEVSGSEDTLLGITDKSDSTQEDEK